jgi:branched-chain amino acid transport system permease protein
VSTTITGPSAPAAPSTPSAPARAKAVLLRPGTPVRLALFALLIAGGIWGFTGSPFINLVAQTCVIYAIASLGQSVLIAGAGQMALSGGAFMMIGAFATGMVTGGPLEPFPLPIIVSAVVGLAIGLLSGLPGLRFSGLYLLLASLALQFIASAVARNYQMHYHPAGVLTPIPHIGSLDLATGRPFYLMLLVVLLIVVLVVWGVERTGVGLAWRALKESEVAAAVSGVDVVRWKLYAFAISGAITAVAGSLFGYLVGRGDYQSYDLNLSISLITMVYIGGIRSRIGAVVGAAVIGALPYFLQLKLPNFMGDLGLSTTWYLSNQGQVNAGLFSLLFLLVVLIEPNGIEGLLLRIERLIRRLVMPRGRRGAAQEAGAEA